MKLLLFQVDAFASRVFGGNPAAVVPLEHWLDDAVLQAIAAENNLSETAFLVGGDGRYRIRWMTPTSEVDLCGHATLASAWVVFHRLEPGRREVSFASNSGQLRVVAEAEQPPSEWPDRLPGDRPPSEWPDRLPGGRLALDFPSRPPEAADASLACRRTGARPRAAGRSRLARLPGALRERRRRPRAAAGHGADRRPRPDGGDRDGARQRLRLRLALLRAVGRCPGRPGHRLGPLHAGAVLGRAPRQDATLRAPAVGSAAASCGASCAASACRSPAARRSTWRGRSRCEVSRP